MIDDPNVYPAGYSSKQLPFYSGLDDGEFEAFCEQLLNLQPTIPCIRGGKATTRQIVTAERLLGGRPQKGADIVADADYGEVWVFQCKHMQSFRPAQVTSAMDLAEQGYPHADQFVLVTTCGLEAEALELIRARPAWLSWNASRLTTVTQSLRPREAGIKLVQQFFGPDWRKALFPCGDQPLQTWQQFFARDLSLEHQQFHHRTVFLPRGNTLSRLENFALSGAGRALVLSASGGQGKSRLLLELARKLGDQPDTPRVRFLNLDRHGLTAEQSDFLAREEDDLLLIVDDAHRLGAAIEDIARAAEKVPTIRLLIATRPLALECIRSRLFQCGYSERAEEPVAMGRWSADEIHVLAERILSPAQRVHAPRLAMLSDRCPLLVLLGGGLINSGKWPETMTDGEAFRERVFRSFRKDVLEQMPEHRRERMDRLINLLSFISPSPKGDIMKAAEFLNPDALAVAEDLESLQAAGIVVENREGIRLYPDLFADVVLLDACLNSRGESSAFHGSVLDKLSIDDFPSLMRNLAQADWEARAKSGAPSSLFDPIWQEFIRRFDTAPWEEHKGFADWVLNDKASQTAPSDRVDLLRQWRAVAPYLPERTVELAVCAVRTAEGGRLIEAAGGSDSDAWKVLANELPPLLGPIVVWHPGQAIRALDILWTLFADEPSDWQRESNAIAMIADAASFGIHKPLSVSETVLGWFESKLREPKSLQRLTKQPWILSALLKPFFERHVEHKWTTGQTLHLAAPLVCAEKTRSLRRHALSLVDRFLRSSHEVVLADAVVPLVREAIHPVMERFGSKPTEHDHESWRIDRFEVVEVIERAIETHKSKPTILLKLRRILRSRRENDPDAAVGDACRRMLNQMPDSFELRMARALSSFAHVEFDFKEDQSRTANLDETQHQWTEFCRQVALEAAQQYPDTGALCAFLREQIRELESANEPQEGNELMASIAEISPAWCSALLEEVLSATDPTLDRFVGVVMSRAAKMALECYSKATSWLPGKGRPRQVTAFISALSMKHRWGETLTGCERAAILTSAGRTDEEVVDCLARCAGYQFHADPHFAIRILVRLKPSGESGALAVLGSLARLSEETPTSVNSNDVARCLVNIGSHCFVGRVSDQAALDAIALRFPREVYEHIRDLHKQAVANPSIRHQNWSADTLKLGPLNDTEYVGLEVEELWRTAVAAEPDSFAQAHPLALIHLLFWSDKTAMKERIVRLAGLSSSARELVLVAKLAARCGARFVFQSPELVRDLMIRAESLQCLPEVRELFWSSACGGGRTYNNDELSPEFRYIQEQADSLANRHADDPILGKFYRGIGDWERQHLEERKKQFADAGDD